MKLGRKREETENVDEEQFSELSPKSSKKVETEKKTERKEGTYLENVDKSVIRANKTNSR